MSTALHDLASAAFAAASLYPDTQTVSPTGAAIDMIAADGPCFAIQQVGDFSDDTTLDGRDRAIRGRHDRLGRDRRRGVRRCSCRQHVQVIQFVALGPLRPLCRGPDRRYALGRPRGTDRRAEEDDVKIGARGEVEPGGEADGPRTRFGRASPLAPPLPCRVGQGFARSHLVLLVGWDKALRSPTLSCL